MGDLTKKYVVVAEIYMHNADYPNAKISAIELMLEYADYNSDAFFWFLNKIGQKANVDEVDLIDDE